MTRWDIGLILGLCPANKRRRYFVTTSLIGWAQPRISPEWKWLHSEDITVTSHVHHGVSKDWPLKEFVQLLVQPNINGNICIRDHFVHAPSQWEMTLQCDLIIHWLDACTEGSLLHYWPFVQGIHWWLVDFVHKVTVIQVVFLYHNVMVGILVK